MDKIVEETLKKYDERDGRDIEESLMGFLYYAIIDENFNEIHYQTTYKKEVYINELELLGFKVEILIDDGIKVFFKCKKI